MSAEKKLNVPLNLLGSELRNFRLQNLAAAPTPYEGRAYFDTVLKTARVYSDGAWVNLDARLRTGIPLSNLATDPLARANHTGTQTASTISDFDTQVRTSRLDQMAAPTSAVSFNNQRITNVATPTAAGDVATKGFVESANTTGNAATATALATARTFSLTGLVAATGVTFDGTGNVALNTAIADGALSIAKTSGLQAALDSKQASLGYTPINKAGDTGVGNLTMSGMLTLAADPTLDDHAANKRYVDQAVANATAGLDPKEAVHVATTGNIALSGIQTIDSVAGAADRSVLVWQQNNKAENGLYLMKSGAWVRRSDATQGKLTTGALVLVVNGATHQGKQFYLQTPDPITVGTTQLDWILFQVGQIYTEGDGINIVGNVVSVQTAAGGGLVVDANGVAIDTTVVVRKKEFTVGNAVNSIFTLTHNFGHRGIWYTVRNTATNEFEEVGSAAPSDNTLELNFGAYVPTNGQYVVTVFG